jgi:hypothetical protein
MRELTHRDSWRELIKDQPIVNPEADSAIPVAAPDAFDLRAQFLKEECPLSVQE